MKIQIEAKAMEMIRHWVDIAEGEVSFLGLVEQEGHLLTVTEVFLPEQHCSSGSTEIEPDGVAKLLVELTRTRPDIDLGKLKFWGHSHVDMDVFWSKTDAENVEEMCNGSYTVSTVFNKKGEMLSRVDVYNPFRYSFDKVLTVVSLPDFGTREECERVFRAKVAERGYSYTTFAVDDGWPPGMEDGFNIFDTPVTPSVASRMDDALNAQYNRLETSLDMGETSVTIYLDELERMNS